MDVVVTAATLAGAEDGLGEIPGHGHISAAHARELAMGPDSRWRRLLVDETTGQLITLTAEHPTPDPTGWLRTPAAIHRRAATEREQPPPTSTAQTSTAQTSTAQTSTAQTSTAQTSTAVGPDASVIEQRDAGVRRAMQSHLVDSVTGASGAADAAVCENADSDADPDPDPEASDMIRGEAAPGRTEDRPADPSPQPSPERSSERADRYTPSAAVRAYVVARDHHCRGPGCQVPAARADLDHQVPWPDGPSTPENLNAKHRRCHNLKTHQIWDCNPGPDGALVWSSRAGRTYTSSPPDYLDDLHPPGTGASEPDPSHR